MKIIVNPHNVKIIKEESEPINELEVNISKCEFEFAEEITNNFTKEAYFTLNGNTYKQTIIDNECDYPSEVLVQSGTLEVGVVAYKVVNGQELIRYNPTSDYFSTWEGSLKEADNTEPITPTDKEQMQSQISQNTSDISDLQANKQDKLTAGDNITIENNVISAVDTIYDDTEIKADIQELQETKVDKDVNNLTYYTLTTETGSKITLSIDSSTYIMTLKLKDKNNNDISTANVDLPLETMVVGARYDSAAKEIVLTLKNGQEVRFSVADLVSGLQTEITENNKLSSDLVDDTNNTNKFVSASEKEQITTNKNDILAIKNGQNIDSFSDVETALNLKEDKSNKVTSISSSSTDTQYPSAKCVYDSQEEQNEQLAELEMLYNAFPTVSAENETIQLDNTAKVKFREIDLKGNTSQVVIPEEQGTIVSNTSINVSDVNTDKENTIEMSGNTYQETTTGKNLFNKIDYQDIATGTNGNPTNVTKTSNSISYKSNGNSNFSGVYISTANIANYVDNYDSDTTYCISADITVDKACKFGSFQTTTDYADIPVGTTRFSVYSKVLNTINFYVRNAVTDGVNVKIEKIMVTTTNDSDYEPYTNGASPNPSYPQNIEVVTGTQNVEVCGKNLFDKNNANIIKGFFSSTKINASSTSLARTAYINCQPNTTYTVSKTQSVRFTLAYSEEIPSNNVSIKGYIQHNAYTEISITTDSEAKYLCVFYYLYNTDTLTEQQVLDSIQIEKSSTATTYEQYQGNTYPINLGNIELCKINTYQDRIYKRNNKWYLEKNIGKVILNGGTSESWTKGSSTNFDSYWHNFGSLVSNVRNGVCNYLKYSTINQNNTFDIRDNSTNTRSILWTYFETNSIGTVDNFKTWLSTHNLIVYYILSTPTTTEITDTTLVNQLNALYNATIYPITNINTDTSNLLPYIDLHYNFVTPSPSPSRPSVVNVVKGNNTITISNSDNTESQVFPINIGDMELCKIGTYQDYIYESNGNWYKKGNVGKVVLNGSETWSLQSINSYEIANFQKPINDYIGGTINASINNYFSPQTTGIAETQTEGYYLGSNKYLSVRINSLIASTTDSFKAWLNTHNTIIYYACTPTDTQITDTTLITQLNNIKKAYSYDTQTNISQTNTDKPFIIYAEAIRSLKDVFE